MGKMILDNLLQSERQTIYTLTSDTTMLDIIVRYNNDILDMGWGHGKHEEDLFLKKKYTDDSRMTCLARMKRLCGGICHWFVFYMDTCKLHVCIESKIWISKQEKKIYMWDLVGRMEGTEEYSRKSCGFYGFVEEVPGIHGVVKIMHNMLNIMLAYRVGDVDGFQMCPIDMKAVEALRQEWEVLGRKDFPEPTVFKQTQKHLDSLAKGVVHGELASMEELIRRADFPETIMVNGGELRQFYVK